MLFVRVNLYDCSAVLIAATSATGLRPEGGGQVLCRAASSALVLVVFGGSSPTTEPLSHRSSPLCRMYRTR